MPFLLALVLIVVLLIAFVATRPDDFRIERSAVVAAPPEILFAQVNDFRNWKDWSPWAKIDPEMKLTLSDPPSGTGATYAWTGNAKAGEGRMEILESRPHDLIRLRLEFLKPFAATNITEFEFTPEGDATRVTWSMFGKRNFGMKAFGVVMNMDRMVGGDFERGLAQMSEAASSETTGT